MLRAGQSENTWLLDADRAYLEERSHLESRSLWLRGSTLSHEPCLALVEGAICGPDPTKAWPVWCFAGLPVRLRGGGWCSGPGTAP